MTYTYNNKNYNVSDAEIDKLVDALDISIAEACEMILSDKEVIVNETVEELTKIAQKNRVTNTIHGAKGEKKERKPREKKENPLKKQIIHAILDGISRYYDENAVISVTNDEKYIDLVIENRNFTVNLVEHRPTHKNKDTTPKPSEMDILKQNYIDAIEELKLK